MKVEKYSKKYKLSEFISNSKEKALTIEDFKTLITNGDWDKFQWCKKQKGKHNDEYYEILNIPVSFDIETSSIKLNDGMKGAITYALGMSINGHVCIMRTWSQFIDIIDLLKSKLDLDYNKRIVIYVHNLSYEYQFMRTYFKWDEVFCLKERKVLYARTVDGIEFRCSYMLSSLSLAVTANDLHTYRARKMVGDLDYSLIRHNKTPMTKKEKGYLINDVRVVTNYIKEKIEEDGDITKIQYTKTGYVRKYCKDKCITNNPKKEKYIALMKNLTLEYNEFLYAINAYSGGFTNACDKNVALNKPFIKARGFDFTSSYPYCMVALQYPMSKGVKVTINNEKHLKSILNENKAVLMHVRFYNLVIKEGLHGHPLSENKCIVCENPIIANGRVVAADIVDTYITDVDYHNIRKFYDYSKMTFIDEAYVYEYGYLPKEIIECVLDFYENKTKLKDVKGKEVEYAFFKSLLNSIYGEMVMNPVRDIIEAPELSDTEDWSKSKADFHKAIDLYNNSKGRYKSYLWGVWITAWARFNVLSGVYECCKEDENGVVDYIYTDTDSIKIQNYERHKEYFDKYNEKVLNLLKLSADYNNISLERYMPCTIKGKQKPLGVWDDEGELAIKALGAKRYIARHDGETVITVAGVSKKIGSRALEKKFGGIKALEEFKDGLIFDEDMCGKQKVYYTDHVIFGDITDYLGETLYCEEPTSIYMEAGTYDMSLSAEFSKYLSGSYIVEEGV